jgi:hypothetical protein
MAILIKEWGISIEEAEYINRQQGFFCIQCHSQMRSMAHAYAILNCYNYKGVLQDFVQARLAKKLIILEINKTGELTKYLNVTKDMFYYHTLT